MATISKPGVTSGSGSPLKNYQKAVERLSKLIKSVQIIINWKDHKLPLTRFRTIHLSTKFNEIFLELKWLRAALTSLSAHPLMHFGRINDDDIEDFDEWFDDSEVSISPEEVAAAKTIIEDRCKNSRLKLEEDETLGGNKYLKLGIPCARDNRWIRLTDEKIVQLSAISFEKYVFISGHDAICSYSDDLIEAGVRPAGMYPASNSLLKRLFPPSEDPDQHSVIILQPEQGENLPTIELSKASDTFLALCYRANFNPYKITLKIRAGRVKTNEQATKLLIKVANATFFQIEMLADFAIILDREKKGLAFPRKGTRVTAVYSELQYPRTEFDETPISLYWYARNAVGMPLLQFLAFYQVIEYYFPTYSRSEAQRKLKSILKEPTFRTERDADIGRLLSAIYISRSGSFGDERSQLKATIIECVDSQLLREFIETTERVEFYRKKDTYHGISINTSGKGPDPDYRADVSERIYNIRCKIVHTKNDARDEDEIEVLLPFSKEADQLSHDLELVQFLARSVLIAASGPFQ